MDVRKQTGRSEGGKRDRMRIEGAEVDRRKLAERSKRGKNG